MTHSFEAVVVFVESTALTLLLHAGKSSMVGQQGRCYFAW
jgi:hypothetical protein